MIVAAQRLDEDVRLWGIVCIADVVVGCCLDCSDVRSGVQSGQRK
jgi:hypothetical protein